MRTDQDETGEALERDIAAIAPGSEDTIETGAQ